MQRNRGGLDFIGTKVQKGCVSTLVLLTVSEGGFSFVVCEHPVHFDSASSLKVQFGFRMKIAIIGQSLFGQEVYKELRKEGHTIVGVFTIPDKDGKADPLGEIFIPFYFSSVREGVHLDPLYSTQFFFPGSSLLSLSGAGRSYNFRM